ncbi:MAG: MATE family efflux transporter [Clostridia bacterium]|nr:MATE family efflux transporter [Clostridia bacterium]
MQNTKTADNPLGYEKISVLLRRFAVPSVVAMLVSSLYNIVDQIFIGQYVGPIGNAATTVAFPLTTICIAISVLVGVGGASRFSIELGKGNKEEAGACVGTGIWTAAVLGIVYAVLAFAFTNGLLVLFGGSGETLTYAVEYSKVVILGMPFLILTNILSNFIRADGNPKFSMTCMIIGAVVNIGLDALFVADWGFNWGMAGAAGATVISQVISFIVAACYIKRFKSVKLDKHSFNFNFKRAIKVCSLGMSNSVNQLAICVVQIVMNSQLDKYATLEFSEAEAFIPLAAFGVVMKVNSILMSVFIGMCQGSQPIVGFNYGARQFGRSKKTCLIAASVCMSIAAIGFIAFQCFPSHIVSIFGSGNEHYIDFAVKTMRIFLSMIVFTGAQMIISNYFSAIGKPIKGVILSLTRQILLIVPLMIILPLFFGIEGILYAAPITDFISFLLALFLILREFRSEGYPRREKKNA